MTLTGRERGATPLNTSLYVLVHPDEVGRVREVIGEGDVLLGVIVESGSLGANRVLPGRSRHYPADHVAKIGEGKVRLSS